MLAESKDISEQYILDLADQFEQKDGYIDVVKLAEKLNISIFEKLLPDNEPGYISFDEADNSFYITVNSNNHINRKRFTIAHELAHFVLHKEEIKLNKQIDRLGSKSLKKAEEEKADRLASEILIPTKSLRRSLSGYGMKNGDIITESIIDKLVKKFNVSKVAMIIRLRRLEEFSVPFIEIF